MKCFKQYYFEKQSRLQLCLILTGKEASEVLCWVCSLGWLLWKMFLVYIHAKCFLLFLHRGYSAGIKRPFSVRFDPYTNSIEVLDNPLKIRGGLELVKDDLKVLTDALNVLAWVHRAVPTALPQCFERAIFITLYFMSFYLAPAEIVAF